MKYVSPIYEVETIETEDIMNASKVAANLGIGLSGDKDTIHSNTTTITLTDENGNAVDNQDPTTSTATGVSIGINFGTLFGN